jgi:leucyl/phenylalanyl-tRNA--protein transferase
MRVRKQISQRPALANDIDGRGERIRTFDPLVPNQMRYQAALRPDKLAILARRQAVSFFEALLIVTNKKTGEKWHEPSASSAKVFIMQPSRPSLPWILPGEGFPPANQAWDSTSVAPGLLAAGGELDVASLCNAYSQGIFPWFSEGQPVLWWSPDPRMALDVSNFRLHRSLRKVLKKFGASCQGEIRIDSAFDQVIEACAGVPRDGQAGTWIVPDMVQAYCRLHRAGFAHSVETWIDGQLVGGLYLVALGKAVFGESMFSHTADASKIALSALVCFCRRHTIELIDCQQNTRHLASLGATEMPRSEFLKRIQQGAIQAPPLWQFDTLYWRELLVPSPTQHDAP